MFRRVVLLALCTALVACPSVQARRLVELDVVDRDHDGWLERFHYRGQDWIGGEPGHRYAVRLTNTTGERVLVVLSVDGVNAVTGETAHPAQPGYVLGPWQSTEINGWRKSLDDVAQFVFTGLPDSYAARTGRPDDVGVIGIAVFEEARTFHYEPAPYGEVRSSGNAREAGAAKAQAPAAAEALARDEAPQRLGTGHGAREWSPVGRTDFVRATRGPAQVTELRYDDWPALAARGVIPHLRRWQRGPRAFPQGFVADPPY